MNIRPENAVTLCFDNNSALRWPLARLMNKSQKQIVRQSVLRKEGRDKVTGATRYVDDLTFPELLYGATVRSPIVRGRICG